MTRKITLGTIVAAVFAIGVLGAISFGANTDYAETANIETSQNGNAGFYVAFADDDDEILIIPDPLFGNGTGFIIDEITCEIDRYDGDVIVEECELEATLSNNNLADVIASGGAFGSDEFEALGFLIENAETYPPNFDEILIEFEIGLLTNQIQGYLDTLDPPIVLPDEIEEQSLELKMSIEDDDGERTVETTLSIEVEFADPDDD